MSNFNKEKEIDIDLLNQLVAYNPDTGVLTWKERTLDVLKALGKSEKGLGIFNTKFANKPIDNISPDGYVRLSLRVADKKFDIRGHRVAWALYYNEWPCDQIDHINGISTDNRIENIRVVTGQENLRNTSMRTDNKSGCMGVHWSKREKKWRSRIGINGNKIQLGKFDVLEDAVAARKEAEIKYGFHKNHGRERLTDGH